MEYIFYLDGRIYIRVVPWTASKLAMGEHNCDYVNGTGMIISQEGIALSFL